jgi:alanine racemase
MKEKRWAALFLRRGIRDRLPPIYQVFDIRTDIRPTVAEVDLAVLRKNVDSVAAAIGPSVGILAVVKADAYGHGAVACARALERKVWGFAVSLVEEGVELRRAGGIEAPIIVLGSFYGYSHRDVVAYRLTPVVSEPDDLLRFARAAAELEQKTALGVHLKIDTGMSRLGLRPAGLDDFLEALRANPAVELTGLCTHLAEADGDDPDPTRAQLSVFDACRQRVLAAGFHPTLTHVANSAGLQNFPAARFDLVRPGLALYRGAMSIKSRIVALRDVPSGTRVSYAGMYRTEQAARIATVPIGYADGYSRRMSGRAEALVGGRRCRVVGAITMDMCMVDVTGAETAVGDEVVLMGSQATQRITANELAEWGGTIEWEVFCSVSKRVPRVYLGERT